MPYLADIIILALLAAALFFILRGQIHRHRNGQCIGGCPGCAGSCSGCMKECADQAKRRRK